jgi:hypothetical protein
MWQPRYTPLYDAAVIRLLNKAGDMKTNLLVSIAEAAKTKDLILTSVKRYADAFRAFRKGRLGDVASLLNIKPKHAHKSWLEYKYGWMPLLMDVKTSAELFAQQYALGGRPPSFKVKEKFTISSERYLTTYFAAFGGGPDAYHEQRYDVLFEARLSMILEVVNPDITLLQQMGLTNPALVVWELVPYSFVFDWFVSVGDWLSAMTAIRGLRVVRPMTSTTTEERYSFNQPAQTRVWENGVTYHNSASTFQFSKREYDRNRWTVPELPRVPSKFDLGFAQLVTSLALFRSNHREMRSTGRL